MLVRMCFPVMILSNHLCVYSFTSKFWFAAGGGGGGKQHECPRTSSNQLRCSLYRKRRENKRKIFVMQQTISPILSGLVLYLLSGDVLTLWCCVEEERLFIVLILTHNQRASKLIVGARLKSAPHVVRRERWPMNEVCLGIWEILSQLVRTCSSYPVYIFIPTRQHITITQFHLKNTKEKKIHVQIKTHTKSQWSVVAHQYSNNW